MSVIQAIVLAIIEGITEFIPVSSTGHMIVASSVMNIQEDPFVKTFTVAVQLGAILAVVALYWRRFIQSFRFYVILVIGFLPAGVIGFFANDYIDHLLERADVVGWMLVAGGIFFLFVDRIFPADQATQSDVVPGSALRIGFFQCIALIPGVSRSAATIIGGLSQKLSRKAAAEFSFFLAVPTMLAATGYKLLKLFLSGYHFGTYEVKVLLIGNAVAFLVAIAAISFFVSFLTKNGFRLFGYYRLLIGTLILFLYYFGGGLQMM